MSTSPLSDLLPLSQGDSLSSLPAPAQRALLKLGDLRRWRSGQVLYRSGEDAESAFVVLSGRVRIRTNAANGDEQILGWLKPGMFGALIPVLSGTPLLYDFVADGPCEARHFTPRRLFRLLENDAATTLAIARMQSLRLSRFLNGFTTQVSASLSDRVWAGLKRLALWQKEGSTDQTGELAITQADLARAVGASRYRVGIELKKLQANGVVALGRGRITLLTRRRSATNGA